MTSIGKLLSPLAMAMTFALAGIASAAPLPGGASSLVETYDDWSVVCQMQAEAPACIVRQVQTNTQANQTVLTIEIGTALAGQFQGALLLPLGLALSQGVQMTIDEAAFGMPLPFSTCLPQGCVVPVTFDADTIAGLKAGKALTIIVAAAASPQPVSLAVSLKGLTSALDRIAALTK